MKIKTTFLKISLLGMSVFILFVAMLWTFGLIHAYSARIIAHISLYGTAISSLSIIFFVYRMLRLVDQSNPFSTQTLQLVRKIKQATLVIFVLFLGLLPMVYRIADVEDAPGVVIIGLGIVTVPLALSVFVATIEKLLESVIQIKHENDLTV
ncbi:MAG TPA: DUF2975 domain-containing protein [Enterococcus sp.]|nr:DUF2975 domain-containing protein [Enterococcus sp.]